MQLLHILQWNERSGLTMWHVLHTFNGKLFPRTENSIIYCVFLIRNLSSLYVGLSVLRAKIPGSEQAVHKKAVKVLINKTAETESETHLKIGLWK